jgi:hypothetical protein
MKILSTILAVTMLMASSGCFAQTQTATTPNLFLVQNGKPRGVIVAPVKPSTAIQNAIDELQYHVKRASGTALQVVDENAAAALPADTARIIFAENKTLPIETYQIKTQGNALIFTGDGTDDDSLQWAVDYYLDTQLGARWLWPGDVGTYVPQHADIPLPQLNYTGRPALEQRNFRNPLNKRAFEGSITFLTKAQYEQETQEAANWLRRFQMGSRSEFKFGHSFTHWWEKYGKTHPDYFAVPPAESSYKQPWPQAGRVKLNLSNTAVDDAIIAEWKAASAPDNWNVCPNDSAGFDTSDGTRAMDYPPNQDPMTIWKTADANLTARYVKFWNRLIAKMRKINPKVTLSSYAYSAYRNPPLNGLKLQPGIVLALVPSYWAQDHWRKWQEAGAQLFLRPNWWHTGGVAPVLPLHQQGDFFKFAQSHNMIGFDSDSLMGYWATQGPMYYVIARLMTHPEMSVDDIINEYCSAFGNASPDIKNYLQYWEDLTTKAAYPAPAGGAAEPVNPGLVAQLVKEHNLSASPLAQGWQLLPYLYTDDVLNTAYAILDQADKDASNDNSFVKQRIQFLRDGLDHLKLTRDVLQLGYLKRRTPEQEKQYETLSAQLLEMRKELTPQHVIWGEAEYSTDKRRHVPTVAKTVMGKQEDLAGM